MDSETRRRKKINGVLRATGGLVLILLVLPTLSLVGVTRFTLEKWALHLAFTLSLQGALLLAVYLGWDAWLKWDPHFLFVPMLAAATNFNSYVLLAPELRQLVLVTWFVAVLFMVGLAGFVDVVVLSAAMAVGYLVVIGRLHTRGFPVNIPFEATYTAAFLVCSLYAGVVFERLRRERQETRALRRQLAELAATDDLTGLPNRRQFEALLAGELARVQRHGSSYVVAMVDVDSFKNYHPFPRREVQPGGALTISAGYATCPDDATRLDELMRLADEALYRAKHLGRNRVVGA